LRKEFGRGIRESSSMVRSKIAHEAGTGMSVAELTDG
jgi:hypothetical protein